MVENITPQLGDFFGVKGGKGVLVRSVEKGSRGEKAGFRAGDVVVKVNNQPVHDTSDFTHALRSSSGGAAAVTVMREKKEQNSDADSSRKEGLRQPAEESFDMSRVQRGDRAGHQPRRRGVLARMGPAIMEKVQQALRSSDMDLRHLDKKLQDSQQKMEERQQRMQERHQKLRHELSGDWAEI